MSFSGVVQGDPVKEQKYVLIANRFGKLLNVVKPNGLRTTTIELDKKEMDEYYKKIKTVDRYNIKYSSWVVSHISDLYKAQREFVIGRDDYDDEKYDLEYPSLC